MSLLLPTSNYIFTALEYILTSLGMWFMFKKMQIKPWCSLIPLYRTYKTSDFLDIDEDGSTYLLLHTAMYILSFVFQIIYEGGNKHLRTEIVLSVVLLILAIGSAIYKIRIYSELARNFSQSRLWTVLWMIFPPIPALLWGFSSKYQPTIAHQKNAAGESGYTADALSEGLTVNIDARKVHSSFKTRYLLRDIHLNIEPGKMVLLLGGSGAGKTTFVNAINGYEPANAQILLDGANVYKNYNRLKYKIGFVPQQDLIRYEDSVEKTLTDAATLRLPTNFSHAEKKARVEEMLSLFGLAPVRDNMVGKQSGGQKKRISIASEFISDPDLFILDEPDSGLDGILARELMQRLHDISRKGKIVIVITHTPDRVIDLFDEVIVLGKDANRTGRLVFHGSIADARSFFNVENMEEIVRKINRVEEGGEGMADALIEKYTEVCHAG